MKEHTKRGRKMDNRLINRNEPYEIEHIIEQMKKEGIVVSKAEVLDFCGEDRGHYTHEQIYGVIRENFKEGNLQSQQDNAESNPAA